MEAEAANNLPRVRLMRSWRLEGAKDFADALNITTAQLYYVLNGKRRSPRVEAALLQVLVTEPLVPPLPARGGRPRRAGYCLPHAPAQTCDGGRDDGASSGCV